MRKPFEIELRIVRTQSLMGNFGIFALEITNEGVKIYPEKQITLPSVQ